VAGGAGAALRSVAGLGLGTGGDLSGAALTVAANASAMRAVRRYSNWKRMARPHEMIAKS
jgi:hypothetical protein